MRIQVGKGKPKKKKKEEEEEKKEVTDYFEEGAIGKEEKERTREAEKKLAPEAQARKERHDIIRKEREKLTTEKPYTFTDPVTGKVTGLSIGGKEFLGLKPEDLTEIAAREGIDIEAIEKKAQQEQTVQEIPQAKELTETGVGAFAGAEYAPERSVIQLAAETPIGQAITGKSALDELKKEGKAQTILDMTKYMQENGLRPDQVSDNPQVQMLLSLELNELDIELIKSGEADVSDLALHMEGLPFVGKIGLGKLITTIPQERIDALEQKIIQIGNTIRDYRMAAARTPAKADDYLNLIEDSEIEIRNAESRIKLMIIQSPYYQNAPEEVETLQTVINRALNRIGDAKNAIQGGETLEEAMALSTNI